MAKFLSDNKGYYVYYTDDLKKCQASFFVQAYFPLFYISDEYRFKEKTAEENLVEESSVISLIEEIEDVFSEVQDRQKRLLSMLLTVEIIKAFNGDVDKAKELLCDKEIFNQEVFDYYEKNGELPTAKQIGKILGVSEQSLSRTYKNFKEKLKG